MTETNFDRLWLLVIITNLTTLLPLPLLGLLPSATAQTDQSDRPGESPVLHLESASEPEIALIAKSQKTEDIPLALSELDLELP